MDYFRLNARLRKLLSPLKDSPLLVQAMMLLVQSESESQAAAASATETQVTTRKLRSETGQVEIEADGGDTTTRVRLVGDPLPKIEWDADVLTQTEFRHLSGITSPLQAQLTARELLSNKSTATTLGNSDAFYPSQKAVKTYVDTNFQPLSARGQANGYAPLNSLGKIDSQYISLSGEAYQGTWDASSNTPSLADGTGTAGHYYRVTVAGTVDFGDGDIAFIVGDDVYYDGTVWDRRPSAGNLVVSVNGKDGIVSLSKSDIGLGDVDNTADADKPISTAVSGALSGKLGTGLATGKLWIGNASGVAAAQTLTLSATAGAFSLSPAGVVTLPNASGSTRGLLSAADWTSFANKQSALGYTPENVANKSTSTDLGTSDVLYPSQKAVKTYVDAGLNGKQATITGGASSIVSTNLTGSRALVSSSAGKVSASSVTATELGYLAGVTSPIQGQLNGKQAAGDYVTRDGTQTITGNKTFGANLLASLNVNAGEDVHAVLNSVNMKTQGVILSGATNEPKPGANSRYSKAGNFIFAAPDTDTVNLFVKTRFSGGAEFTPWRKLWHDANLANPVSGTGVSGRLAVWTETGTLAGSGLLASGQTLQTASGVLNLQPSGGSSRGISLASRVNIYSVGGTGVIRNTVKNLRLAGGDESSDGGNIGLYGSQDGDIIQFRTGFNERMRITRTGDLLLATSVTLSGEGRLQVNGNVNCDDPIADRHAVTRGWLRNNVQTNEVYSEQITVTLESIGTDVAVKTFALSDKLLLTATALPVNDINASSHATVAKRFDGSLISVVLPYSTHSGGILFTGGTTRTLSVTANTAAMENETIIIKLLYLNR